MRSLFFPRWLAAAVLVLGLAACSLAGRVWAAPAQGPVRATQEEHALMLAIFGGDYESGTGSALTVIRGEETDDYFLMTLVGFTELPDGRTVVAVNGHPSDENGADAAAHVSPGMLNVYVLRRVGMAWQAVERHENVARMGSWGEFGSVDWVELGPGKPGFLVFSGSDGLGYMIGETSVFELDREIRRLGSFSTMSGNGGACMPDTKDCWFVQGRIRFSDSPQGGAYSDILVDFSGKHYTLTEGKNGVSVEHLKSTVKQTARYRFNGREYGLVSGTNPVPDI